MFATFEIDISSPVVATAIHNGHELRNEISEAIALGEATRLREEDAHTSDFISGFENRVIVHRSRFEVDINRPRVEAVYETPDDAWGLQLWKSKLSPAVVRRSRELHDEFYAQLRDTLDSLTEAHGGFVLYDVHSYNHRRQGPDHPPADPRDNPQVNLGTGSLPTRWRPVADAFLGAMRSARVGDEPIDARENVKFMGRELAAFVHEHYGETSAALAIEFRKDYVDEWTDEVRPRVQKELIVALEQTVEPVIDAWRGVRGSQ